MNTAKQYLGFDDRLFVLIGLPLTSFFIPQIFFQLYPWQEWSTFWTEWQQAFVFSTSFWALFRTIMVAMRKKYPGFVHAKRRIKNMIVIYVLSVPVVNIVVVNLLKLCSVPDNYEPNIYQAYLTTYSVSFAIIVLYEAIYFYTQLRESITEKEEAKQAQIRSELQGLRNQVNPHFLFNSLNTLMHIVGEDQDLAKRYLQRLSKVYRYILESRSAPLIPLSDELAFIRAYNFLQEERFRGNLQVNIKVDETFENYKIVPLSLQILFENAIKHNIISRKHPLLIEVYVNEHMQLVVTNNLQRKRQVLDSTQVGLENISKRYSYFTEQAIDIHEDEHHFTVGLPLIHPQKSTVYENSDH
ncbi:MAG: histidine kinase [Bacteroidota bacterium]